MGFATDYLAVVDAVKAKLVELKTAGSLKEVYFGPRSKVGPNPVAYVVPVPYEVAGEERVEHHPIRVTVVVAGRDADVEAGLRANIVLAGDCRDKLYVDRTLGGLVSDLFVTSFGPLVEQDENMYLFRSELRVTLTRLWIV